MLHLLAQVRRGSVLHLANDKGTDLGGGVLLATGFDPCITVGVGDDFERDVAEILLYFGVLEFAANQTKVSNVKGKLTV